MGNRRTDQDPPLPPLAVALRDARRRRRRSHDPAVRSKATQAEVAKAAGVTQAAVTGWERGVNTPAPERLPRVATAYGIARPRLTALWLAQSGAVTGLAAA